MTTPEKPETSEKLGIHVSPLRVLVDPTALPRDAFRANREAGFWMLGAEAFIAAGAIFVAVSTAPEAGVALYIAVRVAEAVSTGISEQMREK